MELTLKHISVGSAEKGSFFNLGLTKLCTKLSCRLSQRFKISAKYLCLSSPPKRLKCALISRKWLSSFSPAVFQLGIR